MRLVPLCRGNLEKKQVSVCTGELTIGFNWRMVLIEGWAVPDVNTNGCKHGGKTPETRRFLMFLTIKLYLIPESKLKTHKLGLFTI